MIRNNNALSPLPFYAGVDRQNHRKDYAFGEVFCLLTAPAKPLPFQIIRDTRAAVLAFAKLRTIGGALVGDILSDLVAGGLTINSYTAEGYDVIVYRAVADLSSDMAEGEHYLELSDGVETWFSEVFTVSTGTDCALSIEYGDYESFCFDGGRIDYTGGFRFKAYLSTQLGRPEYFFEEIAEDRDGFSFVEKQISEKLFKFTFLAPEYLLDALRLVRLSDVVTITSKGETYSADSFLFTPTWQEGGFIASAEAEFQTDTVLKKIGKGRNAPGLGGFDNSFDESFNIGG